MGKTLWGWMQTDNSDLGFFLKKKKNLNDDDFCETLVKVSPLYTFGLPY